MKILVLNCGSSSLKYQLIEMDGEKVLAKGLVERIGIAYQAHKDRHGLCDARSAVPQPLRGDQVRP